MSSRRIGRRLVAVVFGGRLALVPFAFAEDREPEIAPLRAAAGRVVLQQRIAF